MRVGENHRPCHARAGTQEHVEIFVRAEHGANRTDTIGGEYTTKVVRDRGRVQVKEAVFGVRGAATDRAVLCWRAKYGPGAFAY